MAALPILNFQNYCQFGPPMTVVWHIALIVANLGHLWPLYYPYLSAYQIWCRLVRIGKDILFCVFYKMAAATILNFQKVLFWTPCHPCIAHFYQHTIFGANRMRISRDTPFCVFSKMADATILDSLFFHPFRTAHDVPVAGFCVSCQWHTDQPEFVPDIMILPFRDFGQKMPIPVIFLFFKGILSP